MSIPSVVSLRGLQVCFGQNTVLHNLSLDVPARGCTVLLGPSGTGKSTLLRLLAGQLRGHPSLRISGEIVYNGQPLDGQPERPALVAQKSQQLVSSVWEGLAGGLPQRSELTRAEQLERITDLLARTGQSALLDHLNRQLVDLSTAQQRAVVLLRGALAAPGLLMVDEPTANLSDEDAAMLVHSLRVIAQRTPLLVVSHHLQQTRQLADHVMLIASGTLQESAGVQEFFETPKSEAARQFLRTGSCPETTPAAPRIASAPAPARMQAAPTGVRGPRGFVWLIEGLVAGTPQPGIVNDTQRDLQALREAGVTRLLSLTESPFPAALAQPHGMQVVAWPIPDMHAPSLEQAQAICADIDRLCIEGETVAVHCKAGLGRTGTVLAAYWIWHHRATVSATEALARVRRLERGMVQSQVQEDFLLHFHNFLKSAPASSERLTADRTAT